VRTNRWLVTGVIVGAALGSGYILRRQAQAESSRLKKIFRTEGRQLLERAAPFLRLPTSPDQPPLVLPSGSGLRCPVTGRLYPYRDGVLYLLEEPSHKTFTQRALDTSLSAWGYDQCRGIITRCLQVPDFPVEVADPQQDLQVEEGAVVLDLACGQGNFTVEWAKRAGRTGLVIGLDYSTAMLSRAAYHTAQWGLDNVLLIHGDAHHLPFADGVFEKVNCSGGFHQFPDLPQALREIARVSTGRALLTASTFAEGIDDPHMSFKRWMQQRFDLHFVPLEEIGQQLAALGYTEYEWSLPGGWFGYASARRY